jgi:hypothetical protein
MLQIKRKIRWTDRYGVLEGSMLYYYKRFSDVRPRVVVSITSAKITPIGKKGKWYCLEILTSNKARIQMRWPHEDGYQKWLDSLQLSRKL